VVVSKSNREHHAPTNQRGWSAPRQYISVQLAHVYIFTRFLQIVESGDTESEEWSSGDRVGIGDDK